MLTGDVRRHVAALKQRLGEGILVLGQSDPGALLIVEELLDQFAIPLLPVLVRSGRRRFPETSDEDSPAPIRYTPIERQHWAAATNLAYEPA